MRFLRGFMAFRGGGLYSNMGYLEGMGYIRFVTGSPYDRPR